MWKESQTLELKTSFGEWKEIVETLCGFANAQGGKVVIGLDDNGQPTDLVIGKGAIEDFLNKVKNNTDPVLYPSVTVSTFGLSEIVEVLVEPSDCKPVFAFGKAFIRVGNTTQKLSAQSVRSLVLRYGPGKFDEQSVPVSQKDFVIARELRDRPGLDKLMSDPACWDGENPKTGLYLSFAEKCVYHEHSLIQAGLFKGENAVVFLDMKNFEPPLLLALEEAMSFVRNNLRMEVVFDGSVQRKEKWAVPLTAVREALVNALVHRDYHDPGSVQVRIHSDRLEIWSPGLLSAELPLDQLGQQVRSRPRNRLLAKIFKTMGVIESFGTGFQRMENDCAEAGIPKPVYREIHGAFVVTFAFASSIDGVGDKVGDRVGDKVGDRVGDRVGEALSESQEKILAILRSDPHTGAIRLSKAIGISVRKVESHLSKLKELNRLQRFGTPKKGYWKVIDEY